MNKVMEPRNRTDAVAWRCEGILRILPLQAVDPRATFPRHGELCRVMNLEATEMLPKPCQRERMRFGLYSL